MDEQSNDLIHVVDDEGNEHNFEVLDAIEDDDGRYVALVPVYDKPDELLNDDGELIILEVKEDDNGESLLLPIEEDDKFDELAEIFEERLSEYYEVEE